jgi:hypothetical protein
MKLKDLITKHFSVKITPELVKKLGRFKLALMSKNEDNMGYFSSFYFGVHAIRFTDEDKENFFMLIDVDASELKKDILTLDSVKASWNVVVDPFNFSCSVLQRMILMSTLSQKMKEDAFVDTGIIVEFKMITSMYSQYFSFQVDENLATLVYEKMSKKFIIKRLGSNYKVLEYFAKVRFDDKEKHKLLESNKVEKFTYYISNLHTTVKSSVLEQYSLLVKVKEEEETRQTSSVLGKGEDDEARIVDVEDIHSFYINAVKQKVFIRHEFINEKLFGLIGDLFSKVKISAVKDTAILIHEKSLTDPSIMNLLEDIVEVCIYYLYIGKLYPPYSDRMVAVIKFLKNYWSSSSLKDKKMNETKVKLIAFVKEATGIKTSWILTSTAIILAIYIYVLAIVDFKRK